ncbi:hypothetical protein SAY86_022185 [Trapa natans]|uniref:Uncharacterized protein n=1 Tax=Trapa natans TaxID=22666 RepID=A0AAN7N0D3_TRANT|nr:hypothetical protein SAY86_022185 [Trapa natans]
MTLMSWHKILSKIMLFGSDDEADKGNSPQNDACRRSIEVFKQKIYVQLKSGDRVSIWKSLLLKEPEYVFYGDNCTNEIINRIKYLIMEPRDGTHLRVVLLASGGHFAGCVFDGNRFFAHKTFNRLVFCVWHVAPVTHFLIFVLIFTT